MEQFIKLYSEFSKSGLKPNEMIVLANLYDRMELSYQNEGFYDSKQHAYYITFTREDLAKKVNVGIATITRVFKTLAKKGWIIVKQRFNSSNRIFLPIALKYKNDSSKVSNLDSNQTKTKQINNKHIDTNVTENDKNSNIKMVNESVKSKDSIVIDEPQSKIMYFDDNYAKQNILNGVKAKVEGCSKPFINTMVKYTKNHKELDKLFGIIFKSKNNAKKSLSNKFKHAEDALTFEKNEYLMPELDRTMNQLLLKVNVENGIKNKFGYIYNSLVKFFKQRVYNYVEKSNFYRNSDFNIPIIKLDK